MFDTNVNNFLYFCAMDVKRYTQKYDFYRSVAIKITKSIELGEELVQELFLILLNKKQEELDRIQDEKKGEAYCIRIMKTQFYSKNTKFNKREIQWRNKRTTALKELPDNSDQDRSELIKSIKIEKIDLIVKQLPFFEREVFNAYFNQDLSFSRFSRDSGISRRTLYNTIQRVKDIIVSNYEMDNE